MRYSQYMNQTATETQLLTLPQTENIQLQISNLFDAENRNVQVLVELAGDEIQHFWMENSLGDKVDILSFLPSRERILAKTSTLSRFSAAIDDYSKAILEWQKKTDYSTEDILAFIHELGHAMDGVQIAAAKFLLRVKAQSPTSADEARFFIQDEEKAQANARKILQLLIRKKILADTSELRSLIENWDTEYQQRIRGKVKQLLLEPEVQQVA